MNLQRKNKVQAMFNMSSLTDIIFLLLIFFMLTSTLVTTNALNLTLPSSSSTSQAQQTVSVSVDKYNNFYLGKRKVTLSQLKTELRKEKGNTVENTIVMNAEKEAKWDNVVQIMSICNELGLKMIAATTPQ